MSDAVPVAHGSSTALDKSGEAIRDMFAGVAPRYDFLNRLLSGRLDVVWRRQATRALEISPGDPVLDLCCGTGDQALAVAGRGARVSAADFCIPMLALARRKYERLQTSSRAPAPQGIAADALALPFADRSFRGATVSFGLRNVADLDAALGELRRVLAPGGQLVILEFAMPRRPLARRLYLFYFRHLLPRIGGLLSPRGSAYAYLPASVLEFPQRDAFRERLSRAGFDRSTHRDLTLGTVCLYCAWRSP
jgi:demethylmenaquinone methyltransferase / 2-methoxy-6-polyprenyl-1,4-benzoquinol methylase